MIDWLTETFGWCCKSKGTRVPQYSRPKYRRHHVILLVLFYCLYCICTHIWHRYNVDQYHAACSSRTMVYRSGMQDSNELWPADDLFSMLLQIILCTHAAFWFYLHCVWRSAGTHHLSVIQKCISHFLIDLTSDSRLFDVFTTFLQVFVFKKNVTLMLLVSKIMMLVLVSHNFKFQWYLRGCIFNSSSRDAKTIYFQFRCFSCITNYHIGFKIKNAQITKLPTRSWELLK